MKRVLFVDDEGLVLDIIERKMSKTDIKCYFATSAEIAIDILKNNDIDVMVSDLQMPGTNGLELSILASNISPRTVRIVLSGSSRTNSIIDAVNEGHIYQYLVKPWHIDEAAIEIIQEAIKVSKKWYDSETKDLFIHVDDLWKFKDLEGWVLLDSQNNIVGKHCLLNYEDGQVFSNEVGTKIKSSAGELKLIDVKY